MRTQFQILVAAALLVLLAVPLAAQGAAEQKVTITMREEAGRMSFRPQRVTLQAGVPTEVVLVNRGSVKHEWMVYPVPTKPGRPDHEWAEENSFFKGVKVEVAGGEVTRRKGVLVEVMVKPGKSATIRFTPTRRGQFEMACLISGHWEAGMKGILVVK